MHSTVDVTERSIRISGNAEEVIGKRQDQTQHEGGVVQDTVFTGTLTLVHVVQREEANTEQCVESACGQVQQGKSGEDKSEDDGALTSANQPGKWG